MASLTRQTIAQMLGRPPTIVARATATIALADPACQVYVSGPSGDAAFLSALTAALGFAPPLEPNHVTGGTTRAFWIAPNRWLVVGDTRLPADGIAAVGGFVSDMTDGLAVFDLSGPAVRQILAMGCSLDFDSEPLAPGCCARTLFAGIEALLYPQGARDRFRLHVERPVASYLIEWFETAAGALDEKGFRKSADGHMIARP